MKRTPNALRRILTGTVVAGLCLGALSACAQPGGSAADNPEGVRAIDGGVTPEIGPVEKGGTLTLFDSAKDPGFDPAKSQSLAVTSAGLVHRRLTTWEILPGQEPKVVPDLATSTGEVSADGLTWTYHLKDNIKFEDGREITSADIKYGLERSFAPTLSGGLGYHKALLAGAEGYEGPYEGAHLDSIRTPDSKTIVFTLKSPYGDWPWIASLPAFAPVPADKDDPEGYSRAPIASGPYRIANYRTAVSVTMERNPYWGNDDVRLAGPDRIIMSLGNDPVVSAQKLIYGPQTYPDSFSSSKVPAAQLITAAQSATVGSRLQIPEPGPLLYLAINTKQIKDVHVRRALNYAIDKNAVNKAAGGALAGAIANTLITPGIPGREEYNLYPAPPEGDLEKAKAELALAQEVPQRTLTLITRNRTEDVLRAEAVARSLTQLGLTVRIDPVESSVYSERTTQGDGASYDFAIASWNPDYPSPSSNIQPLYDSREAGNGGSNRSRFQNPQIDAKIDAALAELNPQKAKKMWAQIDRDIMEQAPSVPLVYQRMSYIRGPKVTNFYVGSFPAYPNYLILGIKND